MTRLLTLAAVVVAAAACTVPEVDLDLPDRSQPVSGTESSETGTSQSNGSQGPSSTSEPATDPAGDSQGESVEPPDSGEIDDLEQLVNDIEALLEGVSDELDQISFEEEGG